MVFAAMNDGLHVLGSYASFPSYSYVFEMIRVAGLAFASFVVFLFINTILGLRFPRTRQHVRAAISWALAIMVVVGVWLLVYRQGQS